MYCMKPWTREEDTILYRDYPFFGDKVELSRAKNQIRARASELGIKNEAGVGRGNKALDGLEEILNCHHPYDRLLAAIIYQAFLDYECSPAEAEDAGKFLASGGGQWKHIIDYDLAKIFKAYKERR